MKSRALIAYFYLSILFVLLFCFCLLMGLEDWRLWIVEHAGFSRDEFLPNISVLGLVVCILFLSFRNLLSAVHSLRSFIGLICLLVICFYLAITPEMRAEDKAIARLNSTLADVGYSNEDNSLTLEEAENYVRKIQAVGEAELALLGFEKLIEANHRQESFWEKLLRWALFGTPIVLLAFGVGSLAFLTKYDLERPISHWISA